MPDLAIRFATYAPNGARTGILPYPLGASVSDEMNDLGQGSIDYLAAAPAAASLEGLCEVAVETAVTGGEWVEFGARLLRLKRGGSTIDETRTRRYQLSSYGFMLGKTRMLREELLDENGDRIVKDSTVGGLVKTLVDEAKLRGNIPGLTYGFTAAVDSVGVAWGGNLPPQTLRYGDDLLGLLRTLADQGHVDWRIVGRELRLYRADGLGQTKPVTLRAGIDLLEAPDDEDGTEMAGRIAVQGDDGRTYEAVSPSMGPWGLWEELVNASGIKDIGGLQYVGETEQNRRAEPRVQMTRALRTRGVPYLPTVDYGVGDTIGAPDQNGASAPLRVRQVTLGISRDGVTANLVLNDRFLEKDVRLRRLVTGVLGSASGSAGGTGTPSPSGSDQRTPAAPTGLSVSSVALFTPDGTPYTVIDAGFVPTSTGEDGVPLEIARHELWGRPTTGGQEWRQVASTLGTGSRITFSPMPVGETWQFRVVGVSRTGQSSTPSPAVTVNLAVDTSAPPEPSAPTVTTRLGVVTVWWDGRDSAGTLMPVDFDHVDVWISPGTVVGSIRPSAGSGSVAVPGLTYGEARGFWFTAVDTSGNVSQASTVVSATPDRVEGPDLKAGSVTAGTIAVGALQAEHLSLAARSPFGEAQQRVPASVTDAVFWDAARNGAFSWTTGAQAWTRATVAAGVGITLTPTGGAARAVLTPPTLVPSSRTLEVASNVVASPGGGAVAGVVAVEWLDASGAVSSTTSVTSAQQTIVAPEGVASYRVVLVRGSGAGAVLASHVQVFEAIGSTGVTITPSGVRVKSTAGAVVDVTGSGITAKNPSGQDTFRVDSETGAATLTGATVRSSASGARTEMNPSGVRVVSAAGQDLVQLGYGIPTGMAVKHPASSALIPLGPQVLGGFATREAWALNVPEGGSTEGFGPWRDYVSIQRGGQYVRVMSPTGRFYVATTCTTGFNGGAIGYSVQMALNFTTVANPSDRVGGLQGLAGSTEVYAKSTTWFDNFSAVNVVELTPNFDYFISIALRAGGASNGGTFWSETRSIYVTPAP